MPNKYGVKCPLCHSTDCWKYGYVPTREGRKDRFKCTRCAHTFYRGQPGSIDTGGHKKRGRKRKP